MINTANELSYIMDYEVEALDNDTIIELFQHLVNTGLAWSLQGHYGRTATALIESGLVTQKVSSAGGINDF